MLACDVLMLLALLGDEGDRLASLFSVNSSPEAIFKWGLSRSFFKSFFRGPLFHYIDRVSARRSALLCYLYPFSLLSNLIINLVNDDVGSLFYSTSSTSSTLCNSFFLGHKICIYLLGTARIPEHLCVSTLKMKMSKRLRKSQKAS